MRRVCLLLLALCLMGCGNGKSTTTSSARETKGNGDTAAVLIDALASDLPPAHPDLYWGDMGFGKTPPAKGSPEAKNSERIRNARERLTALGASAFPALVASSRDSRYSYSAVYAAWRNWSVGDACFMIIESEVDFWGYGYKSRDVPGGRSATKPQYLGTIRQEPGLEAWWKSRQERTLRELQIESLQWTIQQEEKAGFIDDAQRHKVLGPLEKRLAELRAAR